jgi:protein-L-isoaspartate(D-aspartate) O-methyltransferase
MVDINKLLNEKYEKYFEYLNEKMIMEQIIKRGVNKKEIIDAFRKVRRDIFLPPNLKTRSYDDSAIEILPGQTISQPYVVALMLEFLEPNKNSRVLEIGTGTGWQTVLLSKLSKEVYSIDIRDSLYNFATERIFDIFKCDNVKLKIADGYNGWEEFSPFDRIIVSCSTDTIPPKLIEQLSQNNGIMIIPVGSELHQKLNVIKKEGEKITISESIDVVFVRLIRENNNEL